MRHLESKLQIACVKWFRLQYPRKMLFHVPNGGFRNKREAKKLKDEGVVPGVADLILIHDNKPYLFELKVGSNGQSVNQKEFQKTVTKEGCQYHIIKSVDQFIKTIQSIFHM